MSDFRGDGHAIVGPLTVARWCDARTSVVGVINVYEMDKVEWRGMLTPFGIAGIWDPDWDGGWWWI
jgi:hypothetical protein